MLADLLSNNSKSFIKLCETLNPDKKINFYVLPTEKNNINENILLAFRDSDGIKFVSVKLSDIGIQHVNIGDRLTMHGLQKFELVRRTVPQWKVGLRINETNFCYGQNILLNDYSDKKLIIKVCKRFEKVNNVRSIRISFGGNDDSLYSADEIIDKTITCDSLAPIEIQLSNFFKVLTEALEAAYNGENIILAIDSLTRIASTTKALFSNKTQDLLDQEVSRESLSLVSSIFKLGGRYGSGTLTTLGGSIFSASNSLGYRTIHRELQNICNAHIIGLESTNFFGHKKTDTMNTNKSVNNLPHPVFIFGKTFDSNF